MGSLGRLLKLHITCIPTTEKAFKIIDSLRNTGINDPSLRNPTGDWLQRIEGCFTGVNGESNMAEDQDLAPLLAISQKRGQKAVFDQDPQCVYILQRVSAESVQDNVVENRGWFDPVTKMDTRTKGEHISKFWGARQGQTLRSDEQGFKNVLFQLCRNQTSEGSMCVWVRVSTGAEDSDNLPKQPA
ncbi:hypothetical protein EV421DRAFT_1737826 [Armillaria borealis]|uniref:Uncharacterized protein n=1 Tax=Armillaria borealis TaxID=47425 RepID=A0AA39MLX1_9AGAR|nr:hypothetical protein EV421DRAFT_1737826 [Armillaria borealis]